MRRGELHAAVEQKVDESRASTAMQKLTVGHDTESRLMAEKNSGLGPCGSVVPSRVARYEHGHAKLADGHDTDVGSSHRPWSVCRCSPCRRSGL